MIQCTNCLKIYHRACNHFLSEEGKCYKCRLHRGLQWDNNSCTVDGILTMLDNHDRNHPGFLQFFYESSKGQNDESKKIRCIIDAIEFHRRDNDRRAHQLIECIQDTPRGSGLIGSSDNSFWKHVQYTCSFQKELNCLNPKCLTYVSVIVKCLTIPKKSKNLGEAVKGAFTRNNAICSKCNQNTLTMRLFQDRSRKTPSLIAVIDVSTSHLKDFSQKHKFISLEDLNTIERNIVLDGIHYSLGGIQVSTQRESGQIQHLSLLFLKDNHWVHYDGMNFRKQNGFFRVPLYMSDGLAARQVIYLATPVSQLINP